MANWVHYSPLPVTAVRSVAPKSRGNGKPVGLWVSDEAEEQSWSKWCAEANWAIGVIAHAVTFATDARLLRLSSAYEIDAFSEEYALPQKRTGWSFTDIDWPRVGNEWQGILITPYVWERRLNGKASDWYHGWDCASGCIWDAAAIASIRPVASQAEVAA